MLGISIIWNRVDSKKGKDERSVSKERGMGGNEMNGAVFKNFNMYISHSTTGGVVAAWPTA